MYYKFTVVATDMTESDFSNVGMAAAIDTVAPVITHVPKTEATAGLGLRLTATVTDNVGCGQRGRQVSHDRQQRSLHIASHEQLVGQRVVGHGSRLRGPTAGSRLLPGCQRRNQQHLRRNGGRSAHGHRVEHTDTHFGKPE